MGNVNKVFLLLFPLKKVLTSTLFSLSNTFGLCYNTVVLEIKNSVKKMLRKEQKRMKETVLAHFEALSAIPRPSGHEERAAAFLREWALSKGFSAEVDAWKNMLVDIPATAGFENAPRTVLQAHTDMVCVAEPGKKFDRLTDTPTLVYETADDRELLHADGTSLGGDDGLGIATMMAAAELAPVHGPLRLIATADEEDGMSGAKNLTREALDADYLINLDSEEYGKLTNSSAGSQRVNFTRTPDWMDAPYPYGFTVRFAGFRGGHSGCDIHRDRCNVLWLLGQALANVPLAIHSLNGGKASNAIPDEVTLRLVTADPDMLFRAVHWAYEQTQTFSDEPDSASVSLVPTAGLTRTISPKASADLLRLLAGLPCGVLAMSSDFEGLVATSCSTGVAELNADELRVQVLSRSSVPQGLPKTLEMLKIRALAHNFRLEIGEAGSIWTVARDNPLERLFSEAYREVAGTELNIEPLHAGLETAEFAAMNPALSLVSVGATVHAVHSTAEYADLSTVEPFGQILNNVLEKIARLR